MGAKCCKCCCKDDGPKPVYIKHEDRKCTDVLFCILFLLFWVGMIIVAAVGVAGGDPDRLLYGVDYEGNVCGGSTKFVYYPQLTTDILNFAKSGETNPLNIDLYGVCLSACPSMADVVCNANGQTALDSIKTAHSLTSGEVMTATESVTGIVQYGTSDMLTVKQNCWLVPLDTTDYFFRCLWVRNSTTTTVVTCIEPESVAGQVLDANTPANVTDACITKEVTETTTTWGAGAEDDPLIEQLLDTTERMMRYVSDTQKAMSVIMVCGGLFAVIVGFLWLLFVQSCTGCLVWTTILAVVFVLVAGTVYAYDKAGLLDVESAINSATDTFNSAAGTSFTTTEPEEIATSSADMEDRWKYFAYIATGVTVVACIIILWMRKRIKLAIGVIKEAAKSVRSMPLVMLFPVLSVIFIFILLIYWLLIAAFIYSNGSTSTSSTSLTASEVATEVDSDSTSALANLLCAKGSDGVVNTTTCVGTSIAAAFESENANSFMLFYHFCGLLWTSNFISGLFTMCIAGAVVIKYFSADKKNAVKGSFALQSMRTTLFKHLGTVAFGSLIIALVQLARAILAYLDRKSKDVQNKNRLVKYLFKCLACYLWCFERCVKYVSTNAYILTAMRGTSFCSSAVAAVKLIVSNIARVGTLNVITVFIFAIGKILITGICALCAFLWLDNASQFESGEDQLSSLWAPMLLVIIMAYGIGVAFMNVLDIAIDTIFICVCVDTSRGGAGTKEKPYYASKGLLKAIGMADAVSFGAGFQREEEDGAAGAGKGKVVEVSPMDDSKPDADASRAPRMI